jgi:hypothetical protein
VTSSPIPTYRYETSYLNAIIGCKDSMPLELAERIRSLHKDYKVDYDTLPSYLCDGNTSSSRSLGAGKMLVELAAFHLKENYRDWNDHPYDKT